MRNSLVISTFNWPEALNLVLTSILKQRVLPDEVIIADDGSDEDTKRLIQDFQKDFPVSLKHVWHEDEGFTKAKILNKAIAKAKGDYIIQIDGDCICHASFVKDHLGFAETGTYLFGSRVNIKEQHLKSLFTSKNIQFSVFSRGLNKRTRAIHSGLLSGFYGKSSSVSNKYRGCNASFFKSDFIAVNGYNEDFQGWGREDSELAWRFHNNGLQARRLRYRGIVYHIYHLEKSKSRLELNNDIEKTTKEQQITWCTNGVDKYLNEKSADM